MAFEFEVELFSFFYANVIVIEGVGEEITEGW